MVSPALKTSNSNSIHHHQQSAPLSCNEHALEKMANLAAPQITISRSGWKGKRQRYLRLDRLFLLTLITVSAMLLGYSHCYSRSLLSTHVDRTGTYNNTTTTNTGGSSNTSLQSLAVVDYDGKYAKDRVYCMIPFIWNPKIYDVSK